MDERIQDLAAESASQVLQDFRESYPQWTDDKLPLNELAAWLGLEVATFDQDYYPEGTYGFLEPGENLIWLRHKLPEGMHRFTLAHEIGHAVLHRQTEYQHVSFRLPRAVGILDTRVAIKDQCKEQDVREGVTDLLFQDQTEELGGIGISYDPRSQREIAANIFAAELLMPLERVRTLYLSAEIPANELAGVFGVSKSAMLNRLSALLAPSEISVHRWGNLPGLPSDKGSDPGVDNYTYESSDKTYSPTETIHTPKRI